MKFRPVEAEVFQADRRMDRHDEANSRFPKFCERAYKRTGTPPHILTVVLKLDNS